LALTDSAGKISAIYQYLPYGEVASGFTRVENPFTFVGRYGVRDEGQGFFFMKHRFYDARTGRFIQEDPLFLGGGLNLYAYAGQNPANRIDPSGLSDRTFDNDPETDEARNQDHLHMPLQGTDREFDTIGRLKLSDKQKDLLVDAWMKRNAAEKRQKDRETFMRLTDDQKRMIREVRKMREFVKQAPFCGGTPVIAGAIMHNPYTDKDEFVNICQLFGRRWDAPIWGAPHYYAPP
ncbi:MAG: RHS repeat-associated core domain-containing protein, partial [Verrucomicrobia bacterium]|nr:RHS repeat-associated core domain-containing protein [Verrucomicrobiota bacterium]